MEKHRRIIDIEDAYSPSRLAQPQPDAVRTVQFIETARYLRVDENGQRDVVIQVRPTIGGVVALASEQHAAGDTSRG